MTEYLLPADAGNDLFGISICNGVLWFKQKAVANFGVGDITALYNPADVQRLEAIMCTVVPPISSPTCVVLDLREKSLSKEIVRQIPECRIIDRKLCDAIDAYILNRAKTDAPGGKPHIYFREQGLCQLWNGHWVMVAGDELLGRNDDFTAELHPNLKTTRLACDRSLSARDAAILQIRNLAKHPMETLPAFLFTMICPLRSPIMSPQRGLSTFPILSVIGPQNFGKTVLVTRFCLLYDTVNSGKVSAKLGPVSSEKGLISAASAFRDQTILVDDLGIGSHSCVAQRGMQVMDMVLRYAANDSECDTSTTHHKVHSQECKCGVAFTGEIPFTAASDCTRIIQIELSKPLRDGSTEDRTIAATAFRFWMEWFLEHAEQQLELLDKMLAETPQAVHARLQTTYVLMSWALISFFQFALDVGGLTEDTFQAAVRSGKQALQKLLGKQAIYVEDITHPSPAGNLAWYVLNGYQKGAFHTVPSRKKLRHPEDCLVENDALCIQTQTLLDYLRGKANFQELTKKQMTRRLAEEGLLEENAEKRSAKKRINGNRYLELSFDQLKACSKKY